MTDGVANPDGQELAALDPDDLIEPGAGKHRAEVTYREVHTEVRFRGPIPHPSVLEEYDRIVPGSAAKIIAAFTDEGDHRRKLERLDDKRLTRGQWMGFFLAVFFFGIAGYLVVKGHPVAGSVLGTVDLVGLVTVFVVNRRAGD